MKDNAETPCTNYSPGRKGKGKTGYLVVVSSGINHLDRADRPLHVRCGILISVGQTTEERLRGQAIDVARLVRIVWNF